MPEDYFDEPSAATYDESLAAMFDDAVVEPAVAFLAVLAGDGPALELGIGTGRIALPLSWRSVAVRGIDLSATMVARPRVKPGDDDIEVTIGDCVTTRVDRTFRLAYLMFNTIRNLPSQDEQIAWFANAAAHLGPRRRVDSLLRLITALDFEIDTFARLVTGRLRTDPGYVAIQAIPGVGPVLAAVFVAEIGDITRFHRPAQLASWAGLTPPTASPTPPCTAAGSASKAADSCAGPRSRPCNASARTPASARPGTGSPPGGAATSAWSPLPVSSPAWCSTACATTTSAACAPRQRRESSRTRGGRGS